MCFCWTPLCRRFLDNFPVMTFSTLYRNRRAIILSPEVLEQAWQRAEQALSNEPSKPPPQTPPRASPLRRRRSQPSGPSL